MDVFHQRDLILEVSSYLEGFVRKSDNTFNCRCPICGDSERKKNKKRFYIYINEDQTGFIVKCHNCDYSGAFPWFVKNQFPEIWATFQIERFRKKDPDAELRKQLASSQPHFQSQPPSTQPIPWMPARQSGAAYQYLIERGLQDEEIDGLFYAKNFSDLVAHFEPDDAEDYGPEPRIVFPLIDYNENMFGFQGRLIREGGKGLRYLTFRMSDRIPKPPKIFGLSKLDLSQKVWVLEGPIDSLFIPNAIASCGSDLITCAKKLDELHVKDYTFVFDLEPRNKQINRKIHNTIDQGYQVVILPGWMEEFGKDINDYILHGKMTREDVLRALNTHTFTGLRAKLECAKRGIVG